MWDAITSMQVHGQQPPRPIDSYTKLLLHFGGADESTTFTDSGNTGHTVTVVGDTQIDTTQKKFGTGSGLFDGIGDCLTIPDHADFYYGSDPFTIDFWLRRASGATGNEILYYHSGGGGGSDFLKIDINTDNVINIAIWEGAGWVIQTGTLISTTVIGNEQWYHIALIRGWGGNTNDWAVAVDGDAEDTATNAGSCPDNTTVVSIGAYSAGGTPFDGHIDEFRVSKGIARWTSNFNPPIRAY